MKNNPRREFLKKSLLGISGAALLPASLKASTHLLSSEKTTLDLPGRILGKTGIKTPLISMGTSGVTNPNFVKAAYDAGIKLFFTATYYGEGNNEKMVGEAMKDIARDSYILGTAAIPKGIDYQGGVYTKESDYDSLVKKVEDSLLRLNMDHVDVLLLPFAAKRESVFFEPLLRAMEDMKKQGKARLIGIVTHSWCDEALRAAADTKVYDLVMTAYNFRTDNKLGMEDAIAYAVNAGLGVICMKTAAGAYWDKEKTQPINTRAALKWVLQNENISTIVSGMTSIDQLQQNIALMNDLKLTDEELKDLKLASIDKVPGLYCRQCNKCVPQCPHNVDIPTIMRSYMYAYGYSNPAHAKYVLENMVKNDNPCKSCKVCKVNCASGFDVRSKIQDVMRLKDVPADFLSV